MCEKSPPKVNVSSALRFRWGFFDIILSDIRCIRRILFSSCQGKLQRSVCEEGISIYTGTEFPEHFQPALTAPDLQSNNGDQSL